jgi:hypothetical protein
MGVAPGTRFGPYEIARPLGAGGMGEVYEARDTRLDRTVAIKVLPAELAKDAGARSRFDREARAIAALNHPNICALHDIGDADGHGFIVMERLEGETLQERLQRGPLDFDQIVDYGIALADALDAAHSRGLIHRDLKPANVFLTKRGVVKILDFGLAKSLQESDADVTRAVEDALTVAGTTLGTVAYMSPEQLRAEPLDVRTDLFSLGLVLYEMAAGQRAFPGSTSAVVAAGILHQQPPALRTLRPDFPERLEETILKTLEKDLAVRCQSAAELRADLTRVKRGGSSGSIRALAPPPPAPERTAQAVPVAAAATPAPPRRERKRGRSVAVGLVFAAFVILVANWGRQKPPQPATVANPAGQQEALPNLQPPPQPGVERPSRPAEPPAAPPPPEATARGGQAPAPTPDLPAILGPAIETTVTQALNDALSGVPGTTAARGRAGRGQGPGAAALLKVLRSAPPEHFDVVYAANDAEALGRAVQIVTLLSSAGWTNESMTEIPNPQATLGIFAPQVTRGVTALTGWARANGMAPEIRRIPSLPRPRIVIGKQQ